MNKQDFILEIGTEELPANVVAIAQSAQEARALAEVLLGGTELFSDGLAYNLYTTPQRIIIYIKDLPLSYNKVEEGPPKKIAFDKDGKPTMALAKFLEKNQASEKDIINSPKADNEKIKISKTLQTANLIAERAFKLIKYFESFKNMSWDNENPIKFPRPIRWVLALLGDEVIPIRIGDLIAANITYGQHSLDSPVIKVKNAKDFFRKLEKSHIIYDFNKRKTLIEKQLSKRNWHKNYQLLDEVCGLVEYPDFLEGNFSNKYLKLPKEVFIASMSKNQRIFPLEDKQGNLTNKFLAVLNGAIKNKKRIALHYENVLDAKLKDALFFYDEDLKTPISKKAGLLKDMVFHKKLGTYQDKVERIKKLSSYFKEVFILTDKEHGDLIKAVSLCKADLLSHMVGEFPSLQGVMGKYYAKQEGLSIEICDAIEEHYRPRFAGDILPKTKLGASLALLDKFDSVICHFKAGNQPKTGGDLYALRRQAIGIINIILDKKIHLSLSQVYDKAFDLAPCSADKNALKKELMEFLKERLIGIIEAEYKPRHDLTDAVIASGFDDIYNFSLRLEALSNIIDEIYFEQARCVVERTNNITKGITSFKDKIDTALFQMQEERQLFETYNNIKDKVSALIKQEDFKTATKIYGETLAVITNTFFDKVMVNVEDEKIRNNRLKLLKDINQLYTKDIADLAKIERRAIDKNGN